MYGIVEQAIHTNKMVKIKYDKIIDDEREEDIDVDSVDYLQFNTSYTSTPAEGKIYWNADDSTLNVGMKGGDVNLQLGQEQLLYAKNAEGVQINNGQAVRVLDASGSKPRVVLVNNLEEVSYDTIAVATENVGTPNFGYFTTYGYVRDFNTSALTEGAAVYLSSTDGALTSTMPTNPSTCIQIGICLYKHSSQGILFVNIRTHEIHRDRLITKNPTGFVSPENVIVSYNSTARTITLTGTVEAYWQGSKIEVLVSGWVSPPHDDTIGSWFLYYNGTTFVWSNNVWGFDQLQIALVNYMASNKFAMREPHGVEPWEAHEEFHRVIGTYKLSGGDLASYNLNSSTAGDRRPTVSECVIKDEDLPTTNVALTSDLYTRVYLSGTGTVNWALDAAEIIPINGTQPYWNQYTGGAWQQTLLTANQHTCVWLAAIPAANDATSQKYRFLWIQGQSSGTLASQQALTPANLTLTGFLSTFPEYVFIAKIILKYQPSNNWELIQVDSLSGTRYNQTSTTGGYLSSVSTDTTLTGNGTASNPLTTNGLTATKTFYTASSSGGAVNVLNTVTIDKGIITAWTQV